MSELDDLYSGKLRAVLVNADGEWSASPDLSKSIVLAGSFDPLHEGHRQMTDAAGGISGRSVVYEISIENVDKPDLPRAELERRLLQFRGTGSVAVTRAKLFSDKAALLPGAWFVIGYDTAVRLMDDRYYADGDAVADIRRLMSAGVRFFVAGRVDAQGDFRDLSDLDIPADIAVMFEPIPESAFRADISSTELRERRSR